MSKPRTYTEKGVEVTIYQEKQENREESFWYYGKDIAKFSFKNREILVCASGEIRMFFEEDGSVYKNSGALAEALDRQMTDKDLDDIYEFDGFINSNWFDFVWRKKSTKKEMQEHLADVSQWRNKLNEWREAKQMTFRQYNDKYNNWIAEMGGDVCYRYDEALEGVFDLIKDDSWWED